MGISEEAPQGLGQLRPSSITMTMTTQGKKNLNGGARTTVAVLAVAQVSPGQNSFLPTTPKKRGGLQGPALVVGHVLVQLSR